jgi:multiple sugar transport system permease protein
VALYIYQQAFGRFDLGYAAAITVLLFVIILLITLLQLRLLSRRVEY